MNREEIPIEQGDDYLESQTVDHMCPDQASSCRASLPVDLFSPAMVDHSISGPPLEHSINASSIAELPTSPQQYASMNNSVQHKEKEMEQDAPIPGVQKGQEAINLMKRPAEGSSAPQKKSRKTKSQNDVEESDRDRDYYSGIDGAEKKKEEKFACPFYRKDPMRFLECINVKMVTISIVKQHLKRRHAGNSHCSVCNTSLALSGLVEDHGRKESCSHSKTSSLDSIPSRIQDVLSFRSDRRMSSLTQWHEIWVILFGKPDTTPKPLLDGIFKEMTGIIRDIWSQDGSQIVSRYVQTRGLPASSGEMLSSLLELLDGVEDRFENKPLSGEPMEQLADIKEPEMESKRGKRDESRQNSAALAQYPYQEPNLSDFTPAATSALRSRDSLKATSLSEDSYDFQFIGAAFEQREKCSDFAASGFTAYTEPLLYYTVSDPTDNPYDIFKQGPSSQMASPEMSQDWWLFNDNSLDFLVE